ncbi:MAG: B12-binding domain-containing radical SAM protein [Gammaproteobacteria bacterium]|nr:B12-binding domain-containing radical SAM protein [Gammaproteobacteria bacterium]
MKTKVQLFDAQGFWLKKFEHEVDQVVLPLGLMYLASHARSVFREDVEFEIYNTIVDFDNNEDRIAECIREGKPDIIGIRGMTKYQKEFAMIAKAAKENSSALVVGGGPYISSDEHLGMEEHPIDVAVFDEGEATFVELIEHFRTRRSFDGILGLAYRESVNPYNAEECKKLPMAGSETSDVKRNNKRPFLTAEELNAMEFPAYDLIDNAKYATFLSYGYNKRRQGVLYTSRGCPYRCDFCHVLFGKKFRERSPESLYAEVAWLYNDYDIRDFYVVDDIFNLQKDRAVQFFNMLSDSHMGGNIRIYFVNGLRGDRVDKEFVDAAVAAGVVWLAYAVETASPRLQKEVAKHLNIEKVCKTIEYSASKDIAVIYWGMLGIQTETIEEAQATVDLLTSLPGSVIPMLFSNTPYPGTEAWEKLKKREQELGRDMKFQSFSTVYHDFLGLIHKDEHYIDVIKSWSEAVNAVDYMRNATKRLMQIGHTPDDIRCAYELLYRTLDDEKVQGLIDWSMEELKLNTSST